MHNTNWPGWEQFRFLRDNILHGIFSCVYGGIYSKNSLTVDISMIGVSIPDVIVVGEHMSRSIRLPVMQFKWKDIIVTTRYNFHDWKLSISTPNPVPKKIFKNLFKTDNDHLLDSIYFEGFPKSYIYPSINSPTYELTAQFSVTLKNKYEVWTALFLLKRWYDQPIS